MENKIMADQTYDTIDNPYGVNLNRSEDITPSEATGVDLNAGGPSVLTGQALTDAWISTFIKSTNYEPKQRGFLIDGLKGYIEAIDLYISGSIVGGSLDIPNTTDANSFHVDAQGNTWWGSNTAAGYLLANASILNTGVATFGGATGPRIVLDANDEYLYDASIGGSNPIAGDTASYIFRRTDYLSGHLEQFILQKRKSIISNNGNVAEFFYDATPISGDKNFIFLGREGNILSTVADYKTHVTNFGVRDLLQFNTSAVVDGKGTWVPPQAEFQIEEASYLGLFNPGGSRINLKAVQSNVTAPIDLSTGGGGGGILFGLSESAGDHTTFMIDDEANWTLNDLFPNPTDTMRLGGVASDGNIYSFAEVNTNVINIRHPGDNTLYGSFDAIGLANTDVEFSAGTGTLFINAASISPLVSGGASCGLNSNFWSDVFTNRLYCSTTNAARLRLPVGTNMYT
jgi:hypothetical protein